MSEPKRIQRKRTKGWRMPSGAFSVCRPGTFGNRWTAKDYRATGYKGTDTEVAQVCVDAFRAWLTGRKHWAHGIPLLPIPDLSPLRGKDLACWCALDKPCHADVLLELANPSVKDGGK